MLTKVELCNYIDIVLFKKKVSESVYDINFTKNECESNLYKVVNNDPTMKVFKKHSYKYFHDCIECNINLSDNCTIVHANTTLKIDNTQEYLLVNYVNRQQLPLHTFPSKMDVDSRCDSKRVSVKVLNNMYINFDSLDYGDGEVYNHINININLSPSNDLELINQKVEEYTTLLRKESIC